MVGPSDCGLRFVTGGRRSAARIGIRNLIAASASVLNVLGEQTLGDLGFPIADRLEYGAVRSRELVFMAEYSAAKEPLNLQVKRRKERDEQLIVRRDQQVLVELRICDGACSEIAYLRGPRLFCEVVVERLDIVRTAADRRQASDKWLEGGADLEEFMYV